MKLKAFPPLCSAGLFPSVTLCFNAVGCPVFTGYFLVSTEVLRIKHSFWFSAKIYKSLWISKQVNIIHGNTWPEPEIEQDMTLFLSQSCSGDKPHENDTIKGERTKNIKPWLQNSQPEKQITGKSFLTTTAGAIFACILSAQWEN